MGTLKEIENRYYKECNVVILPVKQSNIGYRKDYDLSTLQIRNKPLITTNKNTYQAVELYITSDDEIKEGDWCINNTLKIVELINYIDEYDIQLYSKIIATTDKSLTQIVETRLLKETVIHLPQPSQSFIKKYCELDGINKVLVEYDEPKNWNINTKGTVGHSFYVPKTDSHNTITIKSVKDNWTREEVIDLLKQYQEDFCNFESIKPGLEKLKNTINLPEYWRDWINKNL